MASRTQPRHGTRLVSECAVLDRGGNRVWWVVGSLPGVGQPQLGVVCGGKGHPVQVQLRGGREQHLGWWPAWTVFPLGLRAGEVSSSGCVSLSESHEKPKLPAGVGKDRAGSESSFAAVFSFWQRADLLRNIRLMRLTLDAAA